MKEAFRTLLGEKDSFRVSLDFEPCVSKYLRIAKASFTAIFNFTDYNGAFYPSWSSWSNGGYYPSRPQDIYPSGGYYPGSYVK